MKKLWPVAMVFVFHISFAQKELIFDEKAGEFFKVISMDRKAYLVTDSSVFSLEKKLLKKASFNFHCNDAIARNNIIYLATNRGIKTFDITNNSVSDFAVASYDGKIDHIMKDALNHLWFSSKFKGCYTVTDSGSVEVKVTAPVIYSIANTADSNIWVGTNVGLFKVSLQQNKIDRFVEEGLEGYEIPDNIIEQVFADDQSDVWIVMPDNISFISGKNLNGEIPGYHFNTDRENAIYGISKLNAESDAYIFATTRGLIYISGAKLHPSDYGGEIHQSYNEKAFMIPDALIEKPLTFKSQVVLQVTNTGSKTFFITNKGLWSVSTKKLAKQISGYFTTVSYSADTNK